MTTNLPDGLNLFGKSPTGGEHGAGDLPEALV